MTDKSSTSEFLALEPVNVSQHFTEMQEIPTQGFNALVRAKRNGQWWMLKGLKSEYQSERVYQELLRKEYDILARMQHHGIVAVDGMETIEGYGICIVMEWIDGETLKEWLATKHTRKEKTKIINQLLDAVEYVHQQQIVHRDLKPSNIMITRNGQNVKLIDFGLADTDSYAVFKQPAGTDGYISPEQLSDSTPDSRNDLYSIGSIILAMQMKWTYRWVAHKCQRKIGKRYVDVASLRKGLSLIRHSQRIVCILSLVCVLLLGASFTYRKWAGPRQSVDVVADFKLGYLRYQSWGGGLVTVQSIKDVDSCVEIPRTVTNEGVAYLVTEVTFHAFENYSVLQRVAFPNGKLHIMAKSFKGCQHLSALYFRSKVPPVFGNEQWPATIDDVFENYHFSAVTLNVPRGSASAYRNSAWGRFKNIKEF